MFTVTFAMALPPDDVFVVTILLKYLAADPMENEVVKFSKKLLIEGTRKFADATSLRAFTER